MTPVIYHRRPLEDTGPLRTLAPPPKITPTVVETAARSGLYMLAGRVALEPMSTTNALDAVFHLCSESFIPRQRPNVAWSIGAVPRAIQDGDLVALCHDSVHARIGESWARLQDFTTVSLPGEEHLPADLAVLFDCLIADMETLSAALERVGCRPETLEALKKARLALFEEESHQAQKPA